MNKEDTKKAIAVMQAYVDGKKIQILCGSRYIDVDVPPWEWSDSATEYRVKPEPRVIEAKEGETVYVGTGSILPGSILPYYTLTGPCKFVEVIDD